MSELQCILRDVLTPISKDKMGILIGQWYTNDTLYYLYKIDLNGNVIEKVYLGTDYGLFSDKILGYIRFNIIKSASDKGFLFAGDIYTGKEKESQICVLKTNRDGNAEWLKFYGEDSNEHIYDLEITDDGGFIILGYSQKQNGTYIIKCDKYGNYK